MMELGFLQRLRASELWERVGVVFGTSAGALAGCMAALDRLDDLEGFLLRAAARGGVPRAHALAAAAARHARLRPARGRSSAGSASLDELADGAGGVRARARRHRHRRHAGAGRAGHRPALRARVLLPDVAARGDVRRRCSPRRRSARSCCRSRSATAIGTDGGWVRNYPLGYAYDRPEVELIVGFRYVPRYPVLSAAAAPARARRGCAATRKLPAGAGADRGARGGGRAARSGACRRTSPTSSRGSRGSRSSATPSSRRSSPTGATSRSTSSARCARTWPVWSPSSPELAAAVDGRFAEAQFPFRHDRVIPRITVVGEANGAEPRAGLPQPEALDGGDQARADRARPRGRRPGAARARLLVVSGLRCDRRRPAAPAAAARRARADERSRSAGSPGGCRAGSGRWSSGPATGRSSRGPSRATSFDFSVSAAAARLDDPRRRPTRPDGGRGPPASSTSSGCRARRRRARCGPRVTRRSARPSGSSRVRSRARAGVYVEDLVTGRGAAWNARARFPAASTLKVAIAVEALRAHAGKPEPGSYLDSLLRAMLVESDNDAANALEGDVRRRQRGRRAPAWPRPRRHLDGRRLPARHARPAADPGAGREPAVVPLLQVHDRMGPRAPAHRRAPRRRREGRAGRRATGGASRPRTRATCSTCSPTCPTGASSAASSAAARTRSSTRRAGSRTPGTTPGSSTGRAASSWPP